MTDQTEREARLNAAAKARSAAAFSAAQRAITLLEARGVPVTFAAVAKEARVSLAYVYKNEVIADRIRGVRDKLKRTHRESSTTGTAPSSRGIQTKLDAALLRNAELEAENARLRRENGNLLARIVESSRFNR